MKKAYKYAFAFVALLASATFMASCSDFYDPDCDDELNSEDYISSSTEMYTGFLGILTKVQAAGDKEILLTDTRGELLEPSSQSTAEIKAIYNYDENLAGNSYADPAKYYDIVIACNDYLKKMSEYKAKHPEIDEDVYNALVSSTIRIKTWTYKTIAEIYGKAIWFDDAVAEFTDVKSSSKFQELDIDDVMTKCYTLLTDGYNGVPSNLTINWIEWLDPENVTNIASSNYRKWNFVVPQYEGLLSEICLWRGAAMTAAHLDSEAQVYYETAADNLLSALNAEISANKGSNGYYLPTAYTNGRYAYYWNYATPYFTECVNAIIYDYSNDQTNTLLKHFSNEYPNDYLLCPSDSGMARFSDPTFDPGTTVGNLETRGGVTFKKNSGKWYISKFRPVGSSVRTNAYQDDVHIYIYRATQYHLMLAEALNNLGRFKAMDAVVNNGVNTSNFVAGDAEWKGFTQDWTSDASWGTRKYPSVGLRNAYNLGARTFKTEMTDEDRKYNDEQLADEMMLEFACEGKVYPALIRAAKRWNDYSIVADRVTPKYGAKASEIRTKILAGGYFVPWNY